MLLMDDADLPVLSPVEARVLGCLIEKKELTPDIYPMTANALLSAANQKTSRDPVMALEPADIDRALALLQDKGLVRRQFAARAERFEHLLAQKFSMTRNQAALLGLLLLRGPQTIRELLSRAERMASFDDAEAVSAELDMLIGRRPPLVKEVGRAPGQREDRFAHLLCGDVEEFTAPSAPTRSAGSPALADLEARIAALEERVAELAARLDAGG
jgi:uncharacterized protein YceH (UPF0502 family)